MNTQRLDATVFLALAVFIGASNSVCGDTHTWNGGGANNNMSTGANWLPAAAPVNNDAMIFAGTTRLTPVWDLTPTTVRMASIAFDSSAGTFNISTTGGAFVEVDGGITNNSMNTQTFSGTVRFRPNGPHTINAAAGDFVFSAISLNGTNQTLTFTGANDITVNSAFTQASNGRSVVKSGAGTLTLHGANDYNGGTTIQNSGGILRITDAAGLGTGAVTIQKNGANTGTLELALTGTNIITNTFNGFASATSNTVPQILNTSGNNTITSNLTVTNSGGNGLVVQSSGGFLTLAGNITTTFDSNRLLNVIGAGNGEVTGNITGSGPLAFSVRKDGTGTWTLSGTNTYSGGTSINGGRLNVDGTHTGAGNYNIAGGTTLGGSGDITLNGASTIFVAAASGGGSISPGSGFSGTNPANPADIGTLTISGTGNVIDMNGTLQIDIASTAPGGYDVLNIDAGNIDIDPAALLNINGVTNLTQLDVSAFGMSFGDRITFLTADGISGNFLNFPVNQTLPTASGQSIFFGNDGSSLYLQMVPEPTALGLWLCIAAVSVVCTWQRWRTASAKSAS